ncbi:MAG: D-alanyl-D-alanine carboxypeptidase [Syntrophomonadaceae bacterium]|nr:D-alanyl-D-alanine carboxypeptidase [Syntrophomonadaceae bacterium]
MVHPVSRKCSQHYYGRTYQTLVTLITGLFMVLGSAAPLSAQPESTTAPQVTAGAAVLIDQATGQVLFAQNPDLRKAPASTTKVLTALVALEKGRLHDRITVGPNPPRVEGTRVYLAEGETVTLENLLYAMLLNSGNDAALATAEYYGGSAAGFARLMNQKARELGARNSHFVSPSGLSDPLHYTTARDLALIARAAMRNATFRRIVATRTRPWSGRDWQTTLVNQNKLLWRYEGADGIKTGYTSEARNTLIASATRQGQTLIAVLLDEPRGSAAEQDAKALFDYGFREFRSYTLASKGQVMATLEVDRGGRVELAAARDLAVLLKNDNGPPPAGQLELSRLEGPVTAGSRVGKMVFRKNGKVVGSVNLVNRQAIPARTPSLGDWWLRLTLVIAAIIVVCRVGQKVRQGKRSYRYRVAGRQLPRRSMG